MPLQELVLADDARSLEEALALVADLPEIGADVERADWDRYYRAAALIQVGGDGRVAVVDPLALDDLTALAQVLESRLTVFHAIENDLDPLVTLGVHPTAVADTAIAAAVLGMPTGLEALLRELLDVELAGDKAAMQRADWEARPLTSEMLDYAAGDVADLPALWHALHERLVETGREGWYDQELDAVLGQPSVEQRRDWTRTKGAGRLDGAGRARLRALWDTREHLARNTNTAPGRIASDAVLVDLATTPPTRTAELGRRGVRRQAVRTYGQALLDAIDQAAPSEPVPRRSGRAPTDADRSAADQLRQLRAEHARELGIDPGVLCPSRTLLGAVLSHPETPEDLRAALGLRPWQWQELGGMFCEALGIETGDDAADPGATP